ncbi:hypothetical protein KJ652_04070 [Patescibacteria group bacterium]|nr:hypothetical protein [Patescibacteria group bacterium]MBU1123742.1 hypothetical protein [Patescibacteria group bacterium]MBU1911890.1 hypothetical protein [Patescibacteria group bacterium]
MNQKEGIEVKRETDLGVIIEKPSWYEIAEQKFQDSDRVYYGHNFQDEILHVRHRGLDIAFASGQGSPIAACKVERLRVYGAKAIARIGTCGALLESMTLWDPIITTSCFSDEGTSGHYLPSGYPITSDPGLDNEIRKEFYKQQMNWQEGPTITSDGRWKEDVQLMKELSEIGVRSIEMETSAILAVCLHRKLPASAINIPTDVAVAHSESDLQGVPDRDSYTDRLHKVLGTVIPVTVNALVNRYEELFTDKH